MRKAPSSMPQEPFICSRAFHVFKSPLYVFKSPLYVFKSPLYVFKSPFSCLRARWYAKKGLVSEERPREVDEAVCQRVCEETKAIPSRASYAIERGKTKLTDADLHQERAGQARRRHASCGLSPPPPYTSTVLVPALPPGFLAVHRGALELPRATTRPA
jgi:hypothetical protein